LIFSSISFGKLILKECDSRLSRGHSFRHR
jgi:hypothetical protein